MNTFKFIKLNQNTKTPIKGEYFKDTKQIKEIDTNKYNVGLIAGANNLLILDVDEKDGGRLEWDDYLKENFEPYTMKQKTPNNGLHYIFKHHDETYTDEENEAISKLKNKSKYRNKGLDIRKNNGYIVFEPSTINNKSYKLMNDIQPQKIPLKLVNWLLEFESKEKEAINNNLVLLDNIDELKAILDKLINVSSRQWFNITTAIKNLLHEYNNLDEDDIKLVWKKWSKKHDGYNKQNNLKIWDGITSNINMNFVLSQYNKKQPKENQIELLGSFKLLEQLQKPENIPMITMNNKYIYDEHYKGEQFNKEIFNKYDTIIIRSTTGTGKTSNTARHVEEYIKDHSEYKFMSLVNLRTLSHQHKQTFKNINIVSYENKDELNKEDNNIVICLNSLLMYAKYNGDFFKNYIVYIDEITSFLNSLTHNDRLNSVLKPVYIVLMRIINNAHKVIVSDATINNNTFTFLNKRTNNLYIDNIYKKYEGLTVYKMNDENDFLKKVKENVKKDKYFLFGCDSKSVITKYYLEVANKDNKHKQLITADDKIEIIDASKEFKDKFIFYSPSITTGVDFSIDTPQDVFLYINGRTITPEASFQQLSRTRNIKNVYVYISETESKPAAHNTLNDVKECYKKYGLSHSKLSLMCSSEVDSEYIFNETSFFSLFCFNEYIIDTFNTNKKQHFFNILISNGFNIQYEGQTCKLDKQKQKKMKETLKTNEEDKFIKHVMKEEENEQYKKRFKFLNIIDEETAMKYKDILKDEFKTADYLNLIRLLKQEKNIMSKTKKDTDNLTQYKAVFTQNYKVSLIWQLEKELNITRFQFDKLEEDKPFKISDELTKKIKVSFKCEQYPITYNEYIEYYVNKIKHLLGKIEIITATRKQVNKQRIQQYNINVEELNNYLKLYELSEPAREYLINCKYFYKKENTEVEEKPITDAHFIDELEEMTKNGTLKASFYKSYYPPSCIEYTMNDKELLNIGWSKTNIQDFKTYKCMM